MILRDWDVWHVYSSFLNTSHIDLDDACRALIESGVAVCAVQRDGRTWWQTSDGHATGVTTVNLKGDLRTANIKLQLDQQGAEQPQGYVAEAWYQAGYFRFNELRIFGEFPRIPPPYVRAVVGEFHLVSHEAGLRAIVYPVIKLFETGVVLVEFRTIAPGSLIGLNDFVDRYVNLSFVKFDQVEVPPEISQVAPRAYHHAFRPWPFHLWAALLWLDRFHQRAVREKTRAIPSGDFVAKLAPLGREKGQVDTLSSLAQLLFSIVGFFLSKPRLGIEFAIRGQRPLVCPGNWWSGRPHVYLIDFDGQQASADENTGKFGAQFGRMIGRHAGGDDETVLRYLPPDLRHLNDYSAFVAESASVWVWSTDGKKEQESFKDANRGHLIYEHHAMIEFLEYAYILHRALIARTDAACSGDEIYANRRAIHQLRADMDD